MWGLWPHCQLQTVRQAIGGCFLPVACCWVGRCNIRHFRKDTAAGSSNSASDRTASGCSFGLADYDYGVSNLEPTNLQFFKGCLYRVPQLVLRTQTSHRGRAHTSYGGQLYFWRLRCSSFLGSILESLTGKQVITKKELHRSLPVETLGPKELHLHSHTGSLLCYCSI